MVSVFFFGFCGCLSAQDSDPFGSTPESEKARVARQAKEEQARKAVLDSEKAVAAARAKMERAQLLEEIQKIELKNQVEIRDLKNEWKRTQSELDACKSQMEVNRKELEFLEDASKIRNDFSSELVMYLLNSEKESEQLIALNFLIENLGKASNARVSCVPLTSSLLIKLREIMISDKEVLNEKARWAVMALKPDLAKEAGYQPRTGYWEPVNSEYNGRVYRMLKELAYLDYQESALLDFAEDVEDHYDLEVILDSKIDHEKMISFRSRELSLRDTLEAFFEQEGLTYRLVESGISIYPAGSPKAAALETYNVRGLLSEEVTIEQLVELVTESVNGKAKIRKLDKFRIAVIADGIVQYQVQKALGTLAR
jgi:hypothetical protein